VTPNNSSILNGDTRFSQLPPPLNDLPKTQFVNIYIQTHRAFMDAGTKYLEDRLHIYLVTLLYNYFSV